MSVTHIAGGWVEISGRVVQRCSWCGEKLIDSLGAALPIKEDGSFNMIATWPPGKMVRVTQGSPTISVVLDECDDLPDDSCADLVE